MEFGIVDCNGHKWELYFSDHDGKEGTLLFQGQTIGRFTESAAKAEIEEATGGTIKSFDCKR